MAPTLPVLEMTSDETVKWVWPRPLTFEEFLEAFGPKDFVELIDGVAVETSMVELDHEKLQVWLVTVLHAYTEARGLGTTLGSRTPVRITRYRGRLPDLLFVRRDRSGILEQKAVTGPPDLVIEIASPGERPSHAIALETDYLTIGVPEIVFIDQPERRIRVLRRREDGYVEEIVTEGVVILEAMEGLRIETGWLFDEPRPGALATVQALLGG